MSAATCEEIMDLLDAAGSIVSLQINAATAHSAHPAETPRRAKPEHPMNQLLAAIATDVCRKGLALGALLSIVAICAHSLTAVA